MDGGPGDLGVPGVGEDMVDVSELVPGDRDALGSQVIGEGVHLMPQRGVFGGEDQREGKLGEAGSPAGKGRRVGDVGVPADRVHQADRRGQQARGNIWRGRRRSRAVLPGGGQGGGVVGAPELLADPFPQGEACFHDGTGLRNRRAGHCRAPRLVPGVVIG